MKITQELAFIAKLLDKGILSTPFQVLDTKYFLVNGRIYSDKIFQNELTWLCLETSYNNTDKKKDNLDTVKELVSNVINWRTIDIEDINTLDLVWWIAGIKDTNHGIDIKTYHDLMKLISANKFYNVRLKYNSEWLLAFVNATEDEEVFIITNLHSIQTTLSVK